jgi:uncharacterized protein (TIGR01244 family)
MVPSRVALRVTYGLAVALLATVAGCREAITPGSFEPRRIDDKGVEANYYAVGEYRLAGQPNEEGLDHFKADGIRTVINLRTPEELPDFDEKLAVESRGMAYVSIPVTSQKTTDATVEKFLKGLAGAEKPVVIHCRTAGRVSGLWAAYLALEKGVPPAEAMALAAKSGLKAGPFKDFIEDYLKRKAEVKP